MDKKVQLKNKQVNSKKPSGNKKNGSVSQAAIRKALTIAVTLVIMRYEI